MIRAGRLALPAFLLAALAALFAVLLFVPWSAHAQTVPTLQVEDVSAPENAGPSSSRSAWPTEQPPPRP